MNILFYFIFISYDNNKKLAHLYMTLFKNHLIHTYKEAGFFFIIMYNQQKKTEIYSMINFYEIK